MMSWRGSRTTPSGPADQVFLALLAMTGTTMEQLAGMDKFEPLIAKLEAVSIRISNEIFKYWSQNRNLKVILRADPAKSRDPRRSTRA
jgi:hypothetical protein